MYLNKPRTLKILKDARKLISTPDKWTRGTYARDDGNAKVDVHSPQAVRFCAVGALRRASFNLHDFGDHSRAKDILTNITVKRAKTGIVGYNDSSSYAEVLSLFDDAIAQTETL